MTSSSQLVRTTCKKSWWLVHTLRNLKYLMLLVWSLESLMSKGAWSEQALDRCVTQVPWKLSNHWELYNNLSNRFYMVSGGYLWSHHVKVGPEKPASCKPQSSIQEIKSKLLFKLKGLPPNFSSAQVIELKSPTTPHGACIIVVVFFRSSQSSILSYFVHLAYTIVK